MSYFEAIFMLRRQKKKKKKKKGQKVRKRLEPSKKNDYLYVKSIFFLFDIIIY